MQCSQADPIVLVDKVNGKLNEVVLPHVDERLAISTTSFFDSKATSSKAFRSNSSMPIETFLTSMNDLTITRSQKDVFSTTQEAKIGKLKISKSQQDFSSQRALAQTARVNFRLDVCVPVHLIAPVNAPTFDFEFKALSNTTAFLHKTVTQGLQLVPLDLATASLFRYMDVSF